MVSRHVPVDVSILTPDEAATLDVEILGAVKRFKFLKQISAQIVLELSKSENIQIFGI